MSNDSDAKAIRSHATMAAAYAEISRQAHEEKLSSKLDNDGKHKHVSVEDRFAQFAQEEAKLAVSLAERNPAAAERAMKTVNDPDHFVQDLKEVARNGTQGKNRENLAAHRFQTSETDTLRLAHLLAWETGYEAVGTLTVAADTYPENGHTAHQQRNIAFLANQAYYINKGITHSETSSDPFVQAAIDYKNAYDKTKADEHGCRNLDTLQGILKGLFIEEQSASKPKLSSLVLDEARSLLASAGTVQLSNEAGIQSIPAGSRGHAREV